MKRSIRIDYHYNLSDYNDKISFELQNELEEHAEERIFEMRKDNCTSGELVYYDGETDKEIYGWWDFYYIDPSWKNTINLNQSIDT